MEKEQLEIWANATEEAKKLVKAFEEKGFEVKYVFSGSDTPVVKTASGLFYHGLDNILWQFNIKI